MSGFIKRLDDGKNLKKKWRQKATHHRQSLAELKIDRFIRR
jgi:hypothetical protein